MAATVTPKVPPAVPGASRTVVADVTFDSSYPTGGLSLTPANLGLSYVDFAECHLKTLGSNAVVNVYYDVANQKLKAYTSGTAEVTSTTDLSAVVVQVKASGK